MKRINFMFKFFFLLAMFVSSISQNGFCKEFSTQITLDDNVKRVYDLGTYPWSSNENELMLLSCINYAKDVAGDININVLGASDINKDTFKEAKTIPSNASMEFFVSELKGFKNLKSKNGVVSLSSNSLNVKCYANYYSYDKNDNIKEIYSLNYYNDTENSDKFFIYNPGAFNKKEIKSTTLNIYNTNNQSLNLEVWSYNKNGKNKEVSNLAISPYSKYKIKLEKDKEKTYIIKKSNKKFFAFIKINLKDKGYTIPSLSPIIKSNTNIAKGSLYVLNTKDKKVNVFFRICEKNKICLDNKLVLGAYSRKIIALENYTRNFKNPVFYLYSKNNNEFASFVKQNDIFLPFDEKQKVSGMDILVNYNLSLGEDAQVYIFNENESKDVEAILFVNFTDIKKYKITKNSFKKINLNKVINKRFSGALYIVGKSPISAWVESNLKNKSKRAQIGENLSNVSFSAN